ncbi:MAG: type II secretion system protein [Deltaproteobacteria bacterium]|nr:type II secretion system protein [Deltaproteobacteria bacterium]
MAKRSLKPARGFTLAELAIVAAMIGIAMAIGLASLVDMVTVQRRNAALSIANLTLREQRALALETRKPRYVKPSPSGAGVVIGQASVTPGTTPLSSPTCTEDATPTQLIDMAGLQVSGERICFTSDGTTDDNGTSDLSFRTPGAPSALAAVSVFPAGTMRWSGAGLFQMSGFAMTSISVKSIAHASISTTFIQ